ncbi:MAG: D-alanyl-D-alanine carboxypeptidase [Acidimicrobiia bacterium]|nr:D-alanyl-D-alanine carboxypeptidase [Acidimicrobiia bacterium]
MKNTKNTIIIAFLLTSLILFSYGNSLLLFSKSTNVSDNSKGQLLLNKKDVSNVKPSNFKHSLEVELSKISLSKSIVELLPADFCLIGEWSNSDKEIVDLNPNKALVPGSALKIATAAIVFSNFKKDETLDTTIYGQATNGVVETASMTISGDPSFISNNPPNLGRQDYIENKYTHTFSDLANKLSVLNIKNIKKLVIDTSWFNIPSYNKEWESKKNQVGAMGALLVDEGYEQNSVSLEPQIYASNILKEMFLSKFVTIGTIEFSKKQLDPKLTTKENLLASIQSASIEKLVTDMLKNSNNIYAEQLLIASAHKSIGRVDIESLMNFANTQLNKLVPNTDGLKFLNGSGFSYSSTITCSELMSIISSVSKKGINIISLTSKAGIDGTLANRFAEYKNILQAKTGTLDGVTALIGNIDKIHFSLLVNGQFNDAKGHIYQEKTVALLKQFPSINNLKI